PGLTALAFDPPLPVMGGGRRSRRRRLREASRPSPGVLAKGGISTSAVLLRVSQALVHKRCPFGVAHDPHGASILADQDTVDVWHPSFAAQGETRCPALLATGIYQL